MSICLYHNELGYYCSTDGYLKQSDFVTAATLSRHFAFCCANRIKQLEYEKLTIVEYGGGNGQLAIDLLSLLESEINISYLIVEVNELRVEQLNAKLPRNISAVTKVDLDIKDPIVIIANELFDAQPCNRYINQGSCVQELMVTSDNEKLQWQLQDSERHLPKQQHKQFYNISSMHKTLIQDFEQLAPELVMIFDYGFLEHELYHHVRQENPIYTYKNHKISTDPLILPGKQDLTYMIDFTNLIKLAKGFNFKLNTFCNLSKFLLDQDILSYQDTNNKLQNSNALQILTSPTEMGEIIKYVELC